MAADENYTKAVETRPLVSRRGLSITLWLLGLVVLIAITSWIAYALWPSMLQPTLVMAIYPEGNLNASLVKRYQGILARSGIELKLDPSTGAVESVADLRDPKSGTSVALVSGGITNQHESPDAV